MREEERGKEGDKRKEDERGRKKHCIEGLSSINPQQCSVQQCSVHFRLSRETGDDSIVSDRSARGLMNGSDGLSRCDVVKRGLKLLRFHSRMDIHANPVVKVNVNVASPVTTPIEVLSEDEVNFDLQFGTEDDDIRTIEEGRGLKPPPHALATTPPVGLPHSYSDHGLSGVSKLHSGLPNPDVLYSSQLSLVTDSQVVTSETQPPEDLGGRGHQRNFPLSNVFRRMTRTNHHRPPQGTAEFKGSQEVCQLGGREGRGRSVSLLERCPHLEGVMYRLQWSWDLKMCPY